MSRDDVEVVRDMLQAFNDGDVDGVIAAFDERCELSEPPEVPDTPGRGFRGHDGIRSWMENLRGVGGIRFEPTSFETRGEVIVTEWVGHGVGHASGAPFEWQTFAVIHMRDGKILRAQGFLDRAQALEAAGLGRR